jgi:alpha,alpha-trehalase
MVELLAEMKGPQTYRDYLPQLLAEHRFWMNGVNDLTPGKSFKRVVQLQDGSILNRYYDDNDTPRPESFKEDTELAARIADKGHLFRNLRAACESGWDFSSRWFKDGSTFLTIHTLEIIPVDLNSLLFNLEMVISKALGISGDVDRQNIFFDKAEKRKAALSKYCWHADPACFFDFDFVSGQQKMTYTPAAAFPLYFGLASTAQAKGVSEMLQNHLLCPGGIVTTMQHTGQQWDAPNGWAPLQWISAAGVKKYGYDHLAGEIAGRWISLNEKVYASTGKMMEKYNVQDLSKEAGGGEYTSQDGFGWTNGVYLAFKHWQVLKTNAY